MKTRRYSRNENVLYYEIPSSLLQLGKLQPVLAFPWIFSDDSLGNRAETFPDPRKKSEKKGNVWGSIPTSCCRLILPFFIHFTFLSPRLNTARVIHFSPGSFPPTIIALTTSKKVHFSSIFRAPCIFRSCQTLSIKRFCSISRKCFEELCSREKKSYFFAQYYSSIIRSCSMNIACQSVPTFFPRFVCFRYLLWGTSMGDWGKARAHYI